MKQERKLRERSRRCQCSCDAAAVVPGWHRAKSEQLFLEYRVYENDGAMILVRSRFSILNRYDPTNGTVSPGNVVLFPDGTLFP